MKPVQPFDNFPSFANAGARQAPGDAKYSLGFVPADTLPAEWGNYFFHGATKGISDLNSATRSMWLELTNVLEAKNITPSSDASCTSQLLEALNKIRDDAVALAYPVGTVYINAKSSSLPTSIAQIGTWCAIDGRFLRACASCLGCTGGADSVTLAVCHIPSHCHGTVSHCHTMNHSHSIKDPGHGHSLTMYGQATNNTSSGNERVLRASGGSSYSSLGVAGGNTTGITVCTYSGSTGACAPNTCSTGNGCAFDIIPSYRDVAMWYRDA